MAETVQKNLEETLPELLDLLEKKVYKKKELAELVKARRCHEYRVASKTATVEDFLKYIHFEVENECERKRRSDSLVRHGVPFSSSVYPPYYPRFQLIYTVPSCPFLSM
eukprot:GHVU01012984.1.p3 GENE.GHVU01012984.1~~GHVU01012984.1.p3  ORF type:complete len:109 (+),score=16.10 GHVU01012984.1:2-328(+)